MSAGIANDRIPKKTFDPNPDGMHETCKKCSCEILEKHAKPFYNFAGFKQLVVSPTPWKST